MDYTKFSCCYQVRRLQKDDIPIICVLCEKNPQFYNYCPPFVTPQNIEEDMKALPQRKQNQLQDKYYLGYFDKEQQLVAVLDLIDHCPTEQSVFIGFFMMERNLQGAGIGSMIITELCTYLKSQNVQYIRLGYVDGNEQSKSFWKKNKFTDIGFRNHTKDYTVVVMNRSLTEM